MSRPTVGAVVLTYDRPHLLVQCLDGLLTQTRPPDEVLVVDNGSASDTAELLRARYPQVTLVRIEGNVGASGGFARGIGEAHRRGHDWIWTFDDDDRPLPDALERLLAALDDLDDPAVGLLGSWSLSVRGEVAVEGEAWRGGRRKKVEDQGARPCRVDLVTFSGTLLSGRLISAVGLPKAEYFLSFEDVELCLRAGAAGWAVYVVPEPLTAMLRAGSPAGGTHPWRTYYQARNFLLMALERRRADEVLWWAVRQVKLSLATVLWLDRKPERLWLRARGAWHGIRGVTGRDQRAHGRTPAVSPSPTASHVVAGEVDYEENVR